MIISVERVFIRYECDSCHQQLTVKKRKSLLEKEKHICRTCHAKAVAIRGGLAASEKLGKIHYKNLGLRRGKQSIVDGTLERARKRAVESGAQSKAGKIGGKKTFESGKLQLAVEASKSPKAKKKAFETKKLRGLLKSSKVELKFRDCLCDKFGIDDVDHHVMIDRYHCDFLIKSSNLYIQFDGVYWHGLDRLYEQLDPRIKRKYDIDRELDDYVQRLNIKLVRITDVQFLNESWKEILHENLHASSQ